MRCCNACVAIALAATVWIAEPTPARAEAAGPLTLASLLARFAALPGLDAEFREEKHIALLAAPLVSTGSLHFAPPGALLRRVEAPAAAAVLIDGDRLRLREGARTQELDLDDTPMVRNFVSSFVYLLAGDEASLRRLYDIDFTAASATEGGTEPWTMTLRPREAGMRRVLREVRLAGDGVVLREMVVEETSGDRSVTTFGRVVTTRRRSPDELRRLLTSP